MIAPAGRRSRFAAIGPLLALLAALLATGRAAAVQPAPPPPADPAGLTTFTLDNGLEVWIHPTPAIDAEVAQPETAVSLVIRAGVLEERDDEVGAAYLIKRAAGLGTPSAPADALADLRTRPGRPAKYPGIADGGHALLGYEAAVYTLVFDAGDAEARTLALGHFADLLAGWSPDGATLDRVRARAAERLGDLSAQERAVRAFLPELLGDQPLGRREPIPDAAALAGVTPDAVASYANRWYRPSNAVLIVVGPVDVGQAVATIRAAFKDAAARGPAPNRARAVDESIAGRVSTLAVPGYEPAEIALMAMGPSELPTDPIRREVLDALAGELVGARVRPAAMLADAGVESVEAVVKDWIGGVRIAEVSVRVEPEGLERAGLATAGAIAGVAQDGVSGDEIRSARASVLGEFERDARAWSGADAGEVLAALTMAAREGRAWVSPVDKAAAAARVLAATTDRVIDAHTRAAFKPGSLACVLVAPESEPTDDLARSLLERANAPRAGGAPMLAPRLGPEPAGGELVGIEHEPVTDVWTGTLSNGIVVRVKRMPSAEKTMVRVTIADGVAREDHRTAGRTRDTLAAWRYPRTGSADAGAVRAWSAGRGVRFRPDATDHAVTLAFDASDPTAAGAGDALRMAAWLLAEPRVDAAYVGRVRIREPDFGPGIRRLGELLFEPGETRAKRTPVPERIDAAAADAWLGVLARSPLEVAVVGDAPPDELLELASSALGGLSPRSPPSMERARAWGPLPRSEPLDRVVEPGARPEAVLGVVFADATDLEIVRPMTAAAGAVEAELDAMRRDGRLEGRGSAWVWLGEGIPDRATLVVRWTGASDPEAALGAIGAAVRRVASGESDPAAIEKELARVRGSVDRAWERPEFWADRLARLSSSGLDIGSLAGMSASYQSITPERVRAVLNDAVAAGVHKRVVVTPE